MTYLVLKWLHILSSTLMFGTGLGTVFYKIMVCRTGNLAAMAIVLRYVVLADWLFTLPAVVAQPITGYAMAHIANWPMSTSWIFWSLVLYIVAGACWVPAVWLQIRLRDMAVEAAETGAALSPRFQTYERIWMVLGIPAFFAMMGIYWLMVRKWAA